MNRILVIVAVVVMVAGLYIWQRKQDAEHVAQLHQQAETMRQQAAALSDSTAEQAETMRQQVAALSESAAELEAQSQALKRRVEEDREFAAREREKYISAANIAEGLSVAGHVKVLVAEFYMSEGVWPGSNSALNLPAPDAYKAKLLRSMSVSGNGVIVLTYAPTGDMDAGEVMLKPQFDSRTSQIKWHCESRSYHNIAHITPQCVYTGSENIES